MMVEQYQRAAFERCVNTTFRLTSPQHGQMELRLIEVRAGASSPVYDSYALYFVGPMQRPLPQQIYELAHPRLGLLPVFIVPVARNATGLVYEAVFNSLK